MRKISSSADSEPAVRLHTVPARDAKPVPDSSVGARALVEGYRLHGYRRASINPLEGNAQNFSRIAELDPRTYGFAFDQPVQFSLEFGGTARGLTLSELLSRLRAAYCGSIALDCGHLRSSEQRQWLYARLEAHSEVSGVADHGALRTLEQLAAVEVFEHFHRANFPGYKQFSLEGNDSLVTLLHVVIEHAAHHGVEDLVLALPHRGRLNLMQNALGVPPGRLLSLCSANPDPALAARDLKDHAGYCARIKAAHGDIDILLAHNPSHLESVSPVVCGMARALQDRKADGSRKKVMPVLIHGDASFSAQGIVTETLNMSQTRGYGVGGTLHLIVNNQIGSTISRADDARSTLFGADIARAIDAPIIHVNADDPDAAAFAARLATDYRMRFGADVVVDHVGYRRYGHFVGDDPTFTQPAMQRRIQRHRRVAELYAEQLVRQGVAGNQELDRLKARALATLSDVRIETNTTAPASTAIEAPAKRPVRTAVPIEQLKAMLLRLATKPPDFMLHAGVLKVLENWRSVAGDPDRLVDWRLAENLAYGTVLANGFNVRVTGLDVGRGTFGHRQHVWHDQSADTDCEHTYVPLRHVADVQGSLSIFESPLSEEAVVGFEYGYTLQSGRDLVVWEAQFGDFVNNAQVMIDQYLATGQAKWGYQSGLVCLLPHGHDGWGPEHSCAFIGRFLQLCAADNMQLAMPSTAAQFYHLLRRQALTGERTPLVVMTPKPWLYGCERSYSRLQDLALGEFQPLIRERAGIDAAAVVRAIVTSGKLFYDLAEARTKAALQDVPLLRVEQLYPFPSEALAEELGRFPRLREVVWAQEEAKNHGVWHLVREQLESGLPPGVSLAYAGRPPAAATAVSSPARHAAEQRKVVTTALGIASN